MSIKVKCPGCTKTLTVPDAARGKAVKCPSCETRVPVPADDGNGAETSSPKAKKPAKKVKQVEDESGLAALDLRRVADYEANVCPKCGYDLDLAAGDSDEVVTECPQCGWDVEAGGLGEKARKKAMKGPDPDKFYPGLWKNSWKFVNVNLMIAIRTFLYLALASVISVLTAMGYFYFSMLPPRYMFFAPISIVAALVVPGWLWFLDTETIKLSLERKEVYKRINFDFFLCGALGVKFVAWNIAFAAPLLLIPGAIAWALSQYAGVPWWVGGIILGVCYLPIIGLWPVVLTHMTMPNQAPAWMFWKIVPIGLRCFKPLFVWFLLFMATNLPVVLIMGGTLFFTAGNIAEYVEISESNAEIYRAQAAWEASGSKQKSKLVDPATLGQPRNLEARHLISVAGTAVAWIFCCVILALTGPFNMRTNGMFAYYFREHLDLQVLIKEKKYKAILSREKDEHKIKTIEQIATEAAVATIVFCIMGTIFGLLYGALTDYGPVNGLVVGIYYGAAFSALAAAGGLIMAAFGVSPVWGLLIFFSPCMCGIPHIIFLIQEWEEAKQYFFQSVFAGLVEMLMVPIMVMMGIGPFADIAGPGGQQFQQGPMQPGMQDAGDAEGPGAGMNNPPGAAPPGAPGGVVIPGSRAVGGVADPNALDRP